MEFSFYSRVSTKHHVVKQTLFWIQGNSILSNKNLNDEQLFSQTGTINRKLNHIYYCYIPMDNDNPGILFIHTILPYINSMIQILRTLLVIWVSEVCHHGNYVVSVIRRPPVTRSNVITG